MFPLMLSLLAAAPAEPIRLHPDNPHYLLWRGKPTILVTSGEHYGAVLNLDFDYLPYLDELQRCGLNLTRTFSGVYCESAKSSRFSPSSSSSSSSRRSSSAASPPAPSRAEDSP